MITQNELNKLSREELRELNHRIVVALNYKQAALAITFSVGDRVSFTGKYNQKLTGQVTKVNLKSIKVKDINNGNWKCSPSLLTKI